jgi:hypothetical protein
MTHFTRSTRRSGPGTAGLLAIVLVAATAIPARTAIAQNISGTVAEAETGRQLEGVRVSLVDPSGVATKHAVSQDDGRFAVLAPHPGPWVVTAELLGFQTITSEPVRVGAGEWVVLEITMAAEAIPLDPIVVTARRSIGSPDIQRFYDRRDRASRTGIGHFLARTEIEQMSPNRPSDMLRSMSGVRVVRGPAGRGEGLRMAGGCIPAIYIDGIRINRVRLHDSIDDFVTVMDIEGIEVYRGPSSQVSQYHDPGGCGLVLVWTRAGDHDPDSSIRWTTVLGTVGGILLFMLLLN